MRFGFFLPAVNNDGEAGEAPGRRGRDPPGWRCPRVTSGGRQITREHTRQSRPAGIIVTGTDRRRWQESGPLQRSLNAARALGSAPCMRKTSKSEVFHAFP